MTIDVSAYDADDAQSLLDIFEKPDDSDFEKAKNKPKEDETRERKSERRDKRKRQEENRKRQKKAVLKKVKNIKYQQEIFVQV